MSDTASIIGQAVASMPGSESAGASEATESSTPSTESGSAPVAAAEATADPTESATSAEPAPTEQAQTDETAVSQAEQASGSMPLHRHKAVLTNTRQKYEAQIAAKDSELAALSWARDVPDVQHKLHALTIAETNPKQFVEVLKRLDPAYGKLQWADEATAAPATSAPQTASVPSDMPQPDVELEDGSKFYSAPQQQKLLEWKDAQYQKQLQEALDERFRPMKEQEQARELFTSSLSKQKTVLEGYRSSKPLFKENESAIKALIAKNLEEYDTAAKYGRQVPLLSLQDAYIEVVVPKLVANREQMRRELLAEINARPAAAATARTSAVQPAATGAVNGKASTADLVRASLGR